MLSLGAIMIAALFTFGLTNCEKEDELSDFVLGDWKTEIPSGESIITLGLNFTSNDCTVSGKWGDTPFTPQAATYDINNNTITLTRKDGKKSGDPIMYGTFSVQWTPKGRTMTWTSDNASSVLTYVWTRQ